ncbi:MAG: hypothetical protein UT01_C0008G0017 [Candidatus Daviesbacteria bacterium GW2011_GWA1_38_7]|nr:MAG: hypothetical protein UT01_C0008G0017 [Candidatus Daviesbacteria bacterium GW2011_GWA1_38_7]
MKVLYINTSYDFTRGVNANRVFDFLNFFTQKGIEITHLTPCKPFAVDGVKELIVPFSYTKKPSMYLRFLQEFVSYKDSKQNEVWVDDIKAYVESNPHFFKDFDIVFINTQPRCLIKLAKYFKSKYSCKIVVDLQDPFAYDPYSLLLPPFLKTARQYEKEILADVDLLLTITPSFYEVYKKHYPMLEMLFVPTATPNYLPKPADKSSEQGDVNIVYGGSLHGNRTIFPLLQALRKVKQSRFKVEVLSLNKAIIYIGPPGDNADIVSKYSNNYCVVTNLKRDLPKLVDYLKNYQRLAKNTKDQYFIDYHPEKINLVIVKAFQKLLNKPHSKDRR